jgi:hypothetical protein
MISVMTSTKGMNFSTAPMLPAMKLSGPTIITVVRKEEKTPGITCVAPLIAALMAVSPA